jgi:ABC-type transport system involved in multi-copper enzyme maturation permease subunit
MGELLYANTLTHLRYFRRSRLLVAFGLVFLLLASLESLPAVFSNSKVASFDSLKEIFLTFNEFLIFFAAGFGLMVMSSHLRNRSLKMVFTKPCPPPLWLGSALLACALVLLLLTGLVLVAALALSFWWHIPVRAGLVFISIDTFLAGVGMAAYFIFLTTLIHPAIAVALALVFNATLFYWLRMYFHAAYQVSHGSATLKFFEHLFHGLYLMAPMVHAFGTRTGIIYSSFRVPAHHWIYLVYSLGYILALATLCYLLALFFLQRKKFT